ncbi:MAG: hypothetical protein HS132_05825 [Planctomycetia bacterium]|nr:hypothetical protein [Planctomycetia bacterium]
MVKAPENFLDEYLSHEKGSGIRASTKPQERIRKISAEELARLKQNLHMIWGIYNTPEIKEVLARKHKIRFLDVESVKASLHISYVDKGILMEYELNTGSKKELAGAQIYKQAEMNINRYFTLETGAEELLKTNNVALQSVADVFVEKEIPETDIWNVISKGEQVHLATISCF